MAGSARFLRDDRGRARSLEPHHQRRARAAERAGLPPRGWLERVYVNGGKRGFLIRIAVAELVRVLQPVLVEVGIERG